MSEYTHMQELLHETRRRLNDKDAEIALLQYIADKAITRLEANKLAEVKTTVPTIIATYQRDHWHHVAADLYHALTQMRKRRGIHTDNIEMVARAMDNYETTMTHPSGTKE